MPRSILTSHLRQCRAQTRSGARCGAFASWADASQRCIVHGGARGGRQPACVCVALRLPPSAGLGAVSLAGSPRLGAEAPGRSASPRLHPTGAAPVAVIPAASGDSGSPGHAHDAGRDRGAEVADQRCTRQGARTRNQPPDVWTTGPTCAYCRGSIPARRRVCDRCRISKGSKTVQQWLGEIVKKRSKVLIGRRVANDTETRDRWSS